MAAPSARHLQLLLGEFSPLPFSPFPSLPHLSSSEMLPPPASWEPPHTTAHAWPSLPGHRPPAHFPEDSLLQLLLHRLSCLPSNTLSCLKVMKPPSTRHSAPRGCGLLSVSLPHCPHFLPPVLPQALTGLAPPLHKGQGQRCHTGHVAPCSGPSVLPYALSTPHPFFPLRTPPLLDLTPLTGPPVSSLPPLFPNLYPPPSLHISPMHSKPSFN